jgi:hypothetical protein
MQHLQQASGVLLENIFYWPGRLMDVEVIEEDIPRVTGGENGIGGCTSLARELAVTNNRMRLIERVYQPRERFRLILT